MSKKANDMLRAQYTEKLFSMFKDLEEVMQTGTGEIAFPVVDADGEDNWVVINVKIPSGSRDGDAYDGYAMAQEFQMKCAERERKAEEAARKKAAKIERDRKAREQKKAAKEAHLAQKGVIEG